MIATERLFLKEDRKTVVQAGDRKARFLLCAKGQEIPLVMVKQYGLEKFFLKKKTAENKAVKSTENKGEEK